MRAFALLLLLAGCSKPQRATVAAEDAGSAPSASVPSVASVASAPSSAPSPAPAPKRVKPRIAIKYANDEAPRLMDGVESHDLPAISVDGRHVVILGESETAKSCPTMQLVVLEAPATPGRGRVIRDRVVADECGDYDKDPVTRLPTTTFRKNAGAVNAANAILSAYELRTLDGGAITSVKTDADGVLLRVAGKSATGPLFDIDLAPIRTVGAATLTDATFDVDVEARVVVVRGRYSSVATWLTAAQTTAVFRF